MAMSALIVTVMEQDRDITSLMVGGPRVYMKLLKKVLWSPINPLSKVDTFERKFYFKYRVLNSVIRSQNTVELNFIQPTCIIRYCRLSFCVSCREKRAENGYEKGKSSPIDSKCIWNVTEIVDDMVQTPDLPADKLRDLVKFNPPIEVLPPKFVEGTRKIKMKKFSKEQIAR